MVEANRHLKLLPTSTLDIYKVIEHIDVLSIGIQQHPYTVILTQFGSNFGVLFCTFLSQNDVITAWLRLTDTSNCFPHPHWTYTKCLSTLIGCPLAGIHQHPYTVTPTLFGSDFGILLCTFWSQNDVITSWLRVEANTDRHLMLPPSTLDIYQVFEHIDMLSIGIQQHPYIVIPTLLGSDFGVLGHLWSQNDVITAWLRLTITSNLSLILIFRHIQSI